MRGYDVFAKAGEAPRGGSGGRSPPRAGAVAEWFARAARVLGGPGGLPPGNKKKSAKREPEAPGINIRAGPPPMTKNIFKVVDEQTAPTTMTLHMFRLLALLPALARVSAAGRVGLTALPLAAQVNQALRALRRSQRRGHSKPSRAREYTTIPPESALVSAKRKPPREPAFPSPPLTTLYNFRSVCEGRASSAATATHDELRV